MDDTLLLVHTEADGSLAKIAREALGAARSLGGSLTIGLVGGDAQAAAGSLGGCGAARFLGASGEMFRQPRYATDAAAAEALCRASGAQLILAPATSRWARVLPGVALRLGGRVDTHATRVFPSEGAPAIARWYYRQRMEAVLLRPQRPWIVLLEAGCHPAWTGAPASAALENVPVDLPEGAIRTTVNGLRAPQAEEQTIRPEADLLFVAGAGWTKKQSDGATHADDAERLILEFLRRTQASLGGSKSLVDLSGEGQAVLRCMTHLNQVGQTGATPRHPKGLSTCCHGEEPHVVGWRFIGERRAVNLDPNCGWARGKADVLYIADAFEVLRRINALLGEKTQATRA
ncbi:MAG TPA: electron transfer flavoprotein subunit alpha [Bryobacteraceae bacterium]|nr:electron transfer flavoprotein subunit alpha [Bryobacteraceae bacterium]